MYVSPNHPEYERLTSPPAPPEDQGLRLATIPRFGGDELRVNLDRYRDRPYARLQAWHVDENGEAWPIKGRCVTVRVSELGRVIDALREAERLVAQGHDRAEKPNVDIVNIRSHDGEDPEKPRYIPPKHGGHRHRPPFDPTPLHTAPGTGAEFDEFDQPRKACGNQDARDW
jgi:hypothetical protein